MNSYWCALVAALQSRGRGVMNAAAGASLRLAARAGLSAAGIHMVRPTSGRPCPPSLPHLQFEVQLFNAGLRDVGGKQWKAVLGAELAARRGGGGSGG